MNEDYAELAKKLRLFADGDVREIGRDLILGIIPLDRRDFETWATLMEKASDALTASIAERDALREALKPFAQEANEWPDDIKDDWRICKSKATPITVGDLRRARDSIK